MIYDRNPNPDDSLWNLIGTLGLVLMFVLIAYSLWSGQDFPLQP
jgi:uncharacterized membrane protein